MDLEGFDVGISRALDQVATELNDDIVFVSQDARNLFGDPFLHDLKVDFLHVHLLTEDGRELGALEELRVDARSHGG